MKYTRKKIDASNERTFAIGLIADDTFLKAIRPHLRPKIFTTPYATTVAKWCAAYFDQFGKAPFTSIKDIHSDYCRDGLDSTEAELLTQFLSNISQEYENLPEFDSAFQIGRALNYFQERSLILLKEDLDQQLETGNLTQATEIVQNFRSISLIQDNLSPGYNGAEILKTFFPDPNWIIPGLFTEGFSCLLGGPKVGKSWLALNLSICVATGDRFLGRYEVGKGAVLYLDNEMPDLKVKQRLKKCLNGRNPSGLENLYLQPKGSWPRIHQGGLTMLEDFAKEHPDLKLVVIDVWKLFCKPRKKSEEYSYDAAYEDVGPVLDFANRHNLLVLVLHHLNKNWRRNYDSPFDAYNGSVGFAGAVDNMFALVREGEHAELWTNGKNIEESKTALEFQKEDCTWYWLGDAEKYKLTQDQRAIYEALEEAGEEGMSLGEIAAAVGKQSNNVNEMLYRMKKQGIVEKRGKGYGLPGRGDFKDMDINTPINTIESISYISPITPINTIEPINSPAHPPIGNREYRGYRGYITPPSRAKINWNDPEKQKELVRRAEASYRTMPESPEG